MYNTEIFNHLLAVYLELQKLDRTHLMTPKECLRGVTSLGICSV